MNLSSIPTPFFALAPMDDVTDTVFRQIVSEAAPPDVFFTEFVNVDGLQSPGRPKLLRKLRFDPSERSLIAQIWGKDPENFYKTAQQIADGTFARELGLPEGINFAGIDLNMGCPVKDVVKNGICSALINDRELAGEIIGATRDGLADKLPLSVKTRLGFNEIDMTWIEFLLKQKLNMLTIHGRTRKEMSKVPCHWDEIGKARELRDRLAPETVIVGNGDVKDRAHGEELARRYNLDGIMIGRGIFEDPFAFARRSPWPGYAAGQKIALYKKHVELFIQTWEEGERPIVTLNKFCKVYINGFPNAKETREQLMYAASASELLDKLNSLLAEEAKQPAILG
ncbi:MAG TPA: tRNA-dihydrouridine synthase [Candidatus Saccharimonadales bacterium]|nr:tRNA-dihydrouridine synthase [Candidatus Saccharimonadales bacterium]